MHSKNEFIVATPEAAAKKPYDQPRLSVHGTLAALTAGGTLDGFEGAIAKSVAP